MPRPRQGHTTEQCPRLQTKQPAHTASSGQPAALTASICWLRSCSWCSSWLWLSSMASATPCMIRMMRHRLRGRGKRGRGQREPAAHVAPQAAGTGAGRGGAASRSLPASRARMAAESGWQQGGTPQAVDRGQRHLPAHPRNPSPHPPRPPYRKKMRRDATSCATPLRLSSRVKETSTMTASNMCQLQQHTQQGQGRRGSNGRRVGSGEREGRVMAASNMGQLQHTHTHTHTNTRGRQDKRAVQRAAHSRTLL